MSLPLQNIAESIAQALGLNLVPAPAVPPAVPAPTVATPAGPAAAPATPAPVAAAPPPAPPLAGPGYQILQFSSRGYHLNMRVSPEQVIAAAQQLDQHGFGIDTITGVDWMASSEMEVVYDFYHPVQNWRAAVRTRVPRNNPEVQTISEVFPGANWHERETHDFFGIRFLGHPDLSPLLLPEDATYHPLKKDFAA